MPLIAEGNKVHIPPPFEPNIEMKKEIKKVSSRKLSLPPIKSQTSTEINSVELLNQLISTTSLNFKTSSPVKK